MLDVDLTRRVSDPAAARAAAVVALSAHTGAVLTMVSAPAYDPETVLESDWDYQLFREDPDKPEYNRALQGLYPPGSVLKILTAAIVLDLGRVQPDTTFRCTGSYEFQGTTIRCPRAHGEVDLTEALAVSCNTTFARLAREISGKSTDYARRFGCWSARSAAAVVGGEAR